MQDKLNVFLPLDSYLVFCLQMCFPSFYQQGNEGDISNHLNVIFHSIISFLYFKNWLDIVAIYIIKSFDHIACRWIEALSASERAATWLSWTSELKTQVWALSSWVFFCLFSIALLFVSNVAFWHCVVRENWIGIVVGWGLFLMRPAGSREKRSGLYFMTLPADWFDH